MSPTRVVVFGRNHLFCSIGNRKKNRKHIRRHVNMFKHLVVGAALAGSKHTIHLHITVHLRENWGDVGGNGTELMPLQPTYVALRQPNANRSVECISLGSGPPLTYHPSVCTPRFFCQVNKHPLAGYSGKKTMHKKTHKRTFFVRSSLVIFLHTSDVLVLFSPVVDFDLQSSA